MSIIRRITLTVLFALPLAFVLGLIRPATARADVDMNDYNTYWQVATDPSPPDTNLDYNTYWAEVQAKQEYQQR
jgi:hypothetical protein